jgi:hypothetical protein
MLLFLDGLFQSKSLIVAILGVVAANVQLLAYAKGFLEEGIKKLTNTDS